MSMYLASTSERVAYSAIAYFFEGMSVIPLTGKQCRMKWARFQDTVAIPETINKWHRAGALQNVGIVCGQVSRNLVVMDLDGQAAIDAYEERFPHLLNTFTVLTGSGKGKHLYYRVSSLPPTTRLVYPNHQAIELRANGCYVVAPPSIHPDTLKPYAVAFQSEILELPHLEEVKRWLYSKISQSKPTYQQPIQRTIRDGGVPKWASAALDYECRNVRLSVEGNRSNALNTAAYNLGQIVADGNLSQSTVENNLITAALQTGLSESEARATIASGLKAGLSNPRSQQWARRNSK